ncbi:MAG: iron-sulfur cluster assembly protein [Bacteroidales bacterium]
MEQPDRRYEMESEIVNRLKYVYDPEIPVNVYDLGLIYDVELTDDMVVKIRMTLTAPNCPMADDLIREIHETVSDVKGVREVEINLVFDPPWDKDMMSDEARLELGLL